MKFSVLKNILSDSWQIDVTTFNQYYPLFRNLLNGVGFEKEPEPENSLPYNVSQEAERSKDPQNKEQVAVIPIRGLMLKHDAECGPVGMRTIGARIRQANADPNVIAICMPIESGGGQSTAVPEVAEAMQESNKPIVVWVDGIMASAAMYAGSYANYIYASRKEDWIGSIGTMIEYYAPKKNTEDADGNVYVRIYADDSTEKNYEFEQAINEANFRPTIEKILNPTNKKFRSDIKKNRPNVTDEHLKGGIFKASEVTGILIDEIGSFEKAVQKAYKLGKQNKSDSNMKIKLENFPLIGKLFAKNNEPEQEITMEDLTIIENKQAEIEAKNSALEADLAAKTGTIQELTDSIANKEAENTAQITEMQNKITALETENKDLKDKANSGITPVEKKEDPAIEDAHSIKTKNQIAAEENAKSIKGDD